MTVSFDGYSSSFSDAGFWQKLKAVFRKVGYGALEQALKLYYAARDPDTPAWAKGVIYSALGYLISPVDGVPDAIPVVGYSDDIAVLGAALGLVAAHVKDEHVRRARETLRQWFG